MNSLQTWVEALKISPEKLSEWSAIAPANTPLLVWCLEFGHVSSEDYLEWACQHYGLPVLDSAYFENIFDHQFLEAERLQGPWTPWCFPVGKWDDVTLIACVEPPAERPEGKCAFVLADPGTMHEVWGQSQSGIKSAAADLASESDAPIGINASAGKTFVLHLDDLSVLAEMPEMPQMPEIPADEPDDKTSLTLSSVFDSDATRVNMNVPEPENELPITAPPPPPPKKIKLAQPVPTPAPAKVAAKNVNEESDIHLAFEDLHQEYKATLIMKCRDGFATPYKWDSELPIRGTDDKTKVNLGFPSFFRIVAKTMQPYHGYIIDSPAHREFFASLKFASPPACVTAIPLKVHDKLWGILVAFGDETAQTPSALQHALNVTEKLTQALEPLWAKSA